MSYWLASLSFVCKWKLEKRKNSIRTYQHCCVNWEIVWRTNFRPKTYWVVFDLYEHFTSIEGKLFNIPTLWFYTALYKGEQNYISNEARKRRRLLGTTVCMIHTLPASQIHRNAIKSKMAAFSWASYISSSHERKSTYILTFLMVYKIFSLFFFKKKHFSVLI